MVLASIAGRLNFHGSSTVLKIISFDITGCVTSIAAQQIVQRFLYFAALVSAKTLQKVLHGIPDHKL